jgi:hypothetical protein
MPRAAIPAASSNCACSVIFFLSTASLSPFGRLSMRVADNLLHFEIVADNDQLLDQMKYVVEAHIVRFAFREKLQKLDWRQ